MTSILRNWWYLAAWSEEVGDRPLGRRICGTPMALFRTPDGTASALRDRCPHRFAPLSLGKTTADGIACPYHGLVFDGGGRCVHNPFGPPPAAAQVESFPLVERDDCLWVWHGDPALADPALIPDFADFLYGPEVGATRSRVMMDGSLILGVENLLDLTHSSFLHVPTIEHWETFNFSGSVLTTTWEGEWLQARWTFNDADGHEMFWIQTDWTAPGVMKLSSSTDPSGRHREPPYTQLHIYTPETETSTHYFTADRYDTDIENLDFAQARARLLAEQVFAEDNPVIAAMQQEIGAQDFFELKPVLLSIDKAAVLARRHYTKLLAEQSARMEAERLATA